MTQSVTAPLFEVRDLAIKYHTRDGILTAISGVDFDVHPGEIVGVVGESGCGKSTVAAAVMRLLPPNGEIAAGSMMFQGRDLARLTDEEMRKVRGKEISMIFQDPMTSLNPFFSVETQMLDALRAHPTTAAGQNPRDLAIAMLKRVGIPDPEVRIKEYPHQFSGGMRQRIMVAIALATRPALLVADEPTSALDVTLEAQIVDLISDLRRELGTAVLYITHDLGVVAQLCDRVMVMYAGSIVESGDVYTTFANPRHPYTQALLRSHPSRSARRTRLVTIPGRVPSLRDLPTGCKFAPRCHHAEAICHSTEPTAVQSGAQTVLCHFPDEILVVQYEPELHLTAEVAAAVTPALPPEIAQRAVVETEKLEKHFVDNVGILGELTRAKRGSVRAVDGVDITLRRGETLALVGESGSGKTTLGRTILRLLDPTGGRLVIDGQEITRMKQSALQPLRARMQMIFQDPYSSLSPRMKVSSILQEPFRIHNVAAGPNKVDELLATVGLSSESADKYPHQLSGGQARRVGIARALALAPELLVADEPTAGLDVSVAAGVLNLLKDLSEQLHLTMLIITHNLNVIGFIADRVAVMYLGKVVEIGRTDDIFTNPRHPYTEALISAIAQPDPTLRSARRRILLPGEIPSPRNPPPGCAFHPRCRYAEAKCAEQSPPLMAVDGEEHLSACYFPERIVNAAGELAPERDHAGAASF
ncbi:MAG: ABC transporter ATP-binding protein [Anaerolineae bacterium]|jgi:peptide/nickel transport system ATP-binding protein|nr:ABC transporter ATP-binding protein [Anaerolineae bacterium]